MKLLTKVIVGLVAVLHVYVAWFEVFAWTTRGPKVFSSFPPELFEQTVSLAANQGTYNAFLAAGLFWSLLIRDPVWSRNIAACFLLFVFFAGLMAAATVGLRPGLFQIVPSATGLAMILMSARKDTA